MNSPNNHLNRKFIFKILILISLFIILQLATRSIEPSFGLLFGDLLHDLKVGTTGAAIIISMLDIMMNLSGLFVGPLLKEFSYRKVAIVGSLLCALGLALTSTAESMTHILMTYSVVNGKLKLFFYIFLRVNCAISKTKWNKSVYQSV